MTMIEIMKKMGIKKAEWEEIESGLDGSWVKTILYGEWNNGKLVPVYKKFDKRVDKKYTRNSEYKFFDERKNDKLIQDGWKPVCDTDHNLVKIYKQYFVNTKGEIFRLRKSMNCYNPVLYFEQMMINGRAVNKKDYMGEKE